MTVMVVAHPIVGFNGRVVVDDVPLNFIGGFAKGDVPTGAQSTLTGLGYTLNATPGTNYGDKYVLDSELADPASAVRVTLRAAYGLSVAATVSASGALVAGNHNPVDATGAATAMTLPTGQGVGATISVEKVDPTTNAVSVTGNIRGVPATTITLPWQHETLVLRADASGSWWPVSGHKTKASLDGAYDGAGVFRGRRVQPPVNASFITQFQSGHGWTNFSSTAATVTDDTADYVLGNQSLKVTTKNDNSAGSVQKTGQTINATGKSFRLWVKIENVAQITELIFYAGDSTLTNAYQWTIMDTGGDAQWIIKDGEWVCLTLGFASATALGTPDRTNLTLTRLRVRGNTGQVITAHYGGLGMINVLSATFPKGLVTISCDDTYISQFTQLRPILDGAGWGATAYTIADLVGSSGSYMSLSQLRALEHNNGWEVAGHAYTSANHAAGLANLSAADQDAELKNLRIWLSDNGFRGIDHYAYPLGSFSVATDAVMAKYFASGRTIVSRTLETARPHNSLRIRSRSLSNTTLVSTVQAEIDAVYANGGWYVLTVHDLEPTATLGTQYSIANFQTIINYIAAKGDMPVLTMSEALARMTAAT